MSNYVRFLLKRRYSESNGIAERLNRTNTTLSGEDKADLSDFESDEEPNAEEVLDDKTDESYYSKDAKRGQLYSEIESDALVPAWS